MLTVTKSLRDELVANHGLPVSASEAEAKALASTSVKAGRLTKARVLELLRPAADPANPTPQQVFGEGASEAGGDVRVKHIRERFDCTKATAKWEDRREEKGIGQYEAGKDAFYWETIPGMESVLPGPNMETARRVPILNPSQYEYAKMGALFKAMILRDHPSSAIEVLKKQYGTDFRMTEQDDMLVKSALHEDQWVGPGAEKGEMIRTPRMLKDAERNVFTKSGLWGGYKTIGEVNRDIDSGAMTRSGMMTKAPILNDSTSGGQQAVPQYFDFEAIRTPLLYGELVPFVEITPTDRGGAAHSYSIGTPTFVTTASGSSITAFDATSFVTTFDVTFFPASCGILWGRDFEMDAAPNFGQMVVAQLGDQFKYQMDNWIAIGDGTTQPQGLKNASSTITVTATGSSHATMVYTDALNLVTGVTKPFRKAFGGENSMFISTDKMYKKFMSLATGVTGDTRPIFGMHFKDYQLGDFHFAVQNDIADGTVFFANLRAYRLYRRLGLYFELITTGQTLTLANEKLLFARARFGGKLTLGGYCAIVTSLQIG